MPRITKTGGAGSFAKSIAPSRNVGIAPAAGKVNRIRPPVLSMCVGSNPLCASVPLKIGSSAVSGLAEAGVANSMPMTIA